MKFIELLENRFKIQNPIKNIKDELRGGKLYIEDFHGEHMLIVYNAAATEEDDPCVEIEYHEYMEQVRLRLFGDENEIKSEYFKPHFSSPNSPGRFEADEIALAAHNMLRDVQYLSANKLKLHDLHDDPDVQDELRQRAHDRRMGRRK
jgi:hypothetical protein